ncbi:cysteine dioxygenase [Streptomyces sp. NPDC092296]|uniref:cysteine dioxygenase n=1 Tax=Streptomyces sp. NPDC092296 TaxID=3366012 RepID=UPI003824F44D
MPRTADTTASTATPTPVTPTPTTPTPTAPSPVTPADSGGPTLAELLDFAHRTAADPAAIALLPIDPQQRTWVALEGPGGSEAWLIGWPPGAETGWHDHGGSRGAFVTASGRLTEQSIAVELPTEGWRTLELVEGVDRERGLPVGRGRAFGPRHVHQVVNSSEEQHAISVHVYYPPLPLMRRYSRRDRVLTLETVEVPEEWEQ